MPMEPFSNQELTASPGRTGTVPGAARADASQRIPGRTSEFIRAVPANAAPKEPRVQDLLRRPLAAPPGQPASTAIEHLIALKILTGFPAISPGPCSTSDEPDVRRPAERKDGNEVDRKSTD